MTINQTITNTDYTNIYTKVKNIFEAGALDSGYGQKMSAPTAIPGDEITVNMWTGLRNDLAKIKMHQTGIVIGSLSTQDGLNLQIPYPSMIITDAFREQYEYFTDKIITDKFRIDSSQCTVEQLVDSVRQTNWNNIITHTIVISGANSGDGAADNLRYFFNAGGSIKISASRKGVSTPKNDSWTKLLFDMGDIYIDAHSTTKTGSNGTVSSIGFHELTTSEQQLFKANSTDGVYSPNYYRLTGSVNPEKTRITLNIYFADVGTNNDQNVSGELRSVITQIRPSGTNVNVLPLIATHRGLDAITPTITYRISVDDTKVYEDGDVTFTINTNDVPTNLEPTKVLYWKIVGTAVSSDFTDGMMNGSITIDSTGTATIHKHIVKDAVSEPQKYFSIVLMKDSPTGEMVETSSTVYISDVLTYNISAAQVQVNEGNSVTFNVTSNVLSGTVLYWDTTTVSGALSINDFADYKLSGTVTITNGVGTIIRTIRADKFTDGNKAFKLNLYKDSLGGTPLDSSEDVTIYDTSKSPPVYTIAPNNQTANEGDDVEFTISGGDGNDILYWTTIGTMKATDFYDGTLSGSITLNSNGTNTLTRKIVNDILRESPEYFAIQLRSESTTGNVICTSISINVNDKTPITGIIQPNVTSITEGGTVIFNVWSNAGPGIILYWTTYSDNGVTYTDFADNVIDGTITLNNDGQAIITRPIKADKFTDGPKSFKLRLWAKSHSEELLYTSEAVSILDTSTTPYIYHINPSTTSILEGDTVTMNITSNDYNNVTLYWVIFGTVPSNNFQNSKITGTVTLNNSAGSFNLVTVKNNVLEGIRNFVVQLRKDSYVGEILDTSANIKLIDNDTLNIEPSVTNANEGDVITYNISSNLAANTPVYWSISPSNNSVTDADIVPSSGTVPIGSGGKASFQIKVKADGTTEGDQTLIIQAKLSQSGEVMARSTQVTITDSSGTPPTYVATPNKLEITTGESVTIGISSDTDKSGTTVIYWKIHHLDFTTNQDFKAVSGRFTLLTSGKHEILIETIKSNTRQSNKFVVEFYSDSNYQTTPLAITDNITVQPSSKYQIATYLRDKPTNVFHVGDEITAEITSTPPDVTGTTYYASIDGDITADDLTPTIPSAFTFTNGMHSATATINTTLVADTVKQFNIIMHEESITGKRIISSADISITATGISLESYKTSLTTGVPGDLSTIFDSGEKFYIVFDSTIHSSPLLTWKRYFIINGAKSENNDSLEGTLIEGTFTLDASGKYVGLTDGFTFKSTADATITSATVYFQILNSAGNIIATSDNITIKRLVQQSVEYTITPTQLSRQEGDSLEVKITTSSTIPVQVSASFVNVDAKFVSTSLSIPEIQLVDITSSTTYTYTVSLPKLLPTLPNSTYKTKLVLTNSNGALIKESAYISITRSANNYSVEVISGSAKPGDTVIINVNTPGLSNVNVPISAVGTNPFSNLPTSVSVVNGKWTSSTIRTNTYANPHPTPYQICIYPDDSAKKTISNTFTLSRPSTEPGPTPLPVPAVTIGISNDANGIMGETIKFKLTNSGSLTNGDYKINRSDVPIINGNIAIDEWLNGKYNSRFITFNTSSLTSTSNTIPLTIAANQTSVPSNSAIADIILYRPTLEIIKKDDGISIAGDTVTVDRSRPSLMASIKFSLLESGTKFNNNPFVLNVQIASINNATNFTTVDGIYNIDYDLKNAPDGTYTITVKRPDGIAFIAKTFELKSVVVRPPNITFYWERPGLHELPIPAGITTIRAELYGGGGGGGGADTANIDGTGAANVGQAGTPGAKVVSKISVTPGEKLYISVGMGGGHGATNAVYTGGGPGGISNLGLADAGGHGGDAGKNGWSGGGGGGGAPSAIFRANSSVIAVAGGGGGGGGGATHNTESRTLLKTSHTGTTNPGADGRPAGDTDGGGGGGGGGGYPGGGGGNGGSGDHAGQGGAPGGSYGDTDGYIEFGGSAGGAPGVSGDHGIVIIQFL